MYKCDFFKQLRIDKNYTQASIAKYVGVSSRTLYNYECGATCIPDKVFDCLCRLYDLTPDLVSNFLETKAATITSLDELVPQYRSFEDYDEDPRIQKKSAEFLDNLKVKEYSVRRTNAMTIYMEQFINDKNVDSCDKRKVAVDMLNLLFDYLHITK